MKRKTQPTPRPAKPSEGELDEAAEHLAQLASDPRLIPGIFNYCDRWCERCPQTGRCLNFKMRQTREKQYSGSTPDDGANGEFWNELTKSFALAMHMVRREAKKAGIDLDSPDVMEAAKTEEKRRRRLAAREGSGLHRAATAYFKSAKPLLDRLPADLRDAENALNTQRRLGVGDPLATVAEISDALEVVHWYLFFIDVKLSRATAGRVDEAIEGADGFPSDADGSAKVALIAIDRSLAAWARLRPQLDGSADVILDLLVQLEKLRRSVEREFPRARAFKRPGFD